MDRTVDCACVQTGGKGFAAFKETKAEILNKINPAFIKLMHRDEVCVQILALLVCAVCVHV